MVAKRVLIWASGLLLGAGVESLLSQEADFEVIGIEAEDDEHLFKAIEQYQPSYIILNEYTFLANGSRFTRILMQYPELCVIAISPDDNWLHQYQKKDILLTQASDLAQIIRSH